MARDLTRGQRTAAEQAELRRNEKGFTHADLADMIGITEKAVSNFLNAKSWPHGKTRAGFEKALGWRIGYLTEIASRYDAGVQVLDDTAPEERRLLELVQLLRVALDEIPVSRHGQKVARELKRLTEQLVELGGGQFQNVRPLKLRTLEEIDADIALEEDLRADTLESGIPGAAVIVRDVHDRKLAGLRAERELVVTHSKSTDTGS